jgi:hypothetical protein
MTEIAVREGQSRRNLLKRAFVLAGGAVGLTLAGKDARAAVGGGGGGGGLRLYGSNWRLATPLRKPGEAIQPGDHGAVYGDLLDGPKGKVLGQFYGSRLALQATPGHVRADASVEVHTFVLRDGTIVGMGTSVLGRAVFAVVGGTGKYAGANGSYQATQRLREHGGNGTAEFILTLQA